MFSLAAFAALSQPVWVPPSARTNATPYFAYLRAPDFVLPCDPAALSHAPLLWSALPSPNVGGQGTTQGKLLGAAVVVLNGVALSAGPGHSAPSSGQPVRALDVLPLQLLRPPPQANTLAVRGYFAASWPEVGAGGGDSGGGGGRVQVLLQALATGGAVLNVSSGATWSAFDGDAFHCPAGDATRAANWYRVPDENLDARARPTGWDAPGFAPWPAFGQLPSE